MKRTRQASRTCLRRVPDLTKIHNLVGYAPTVSLDEILALVITHMREALAPQGL